jgi:small subunit ribosomal protein S5
MTPDEFGDDFVEYVRELDEMNGISRDIVPMDKAYALYQEMRSRKLSKASGKALTKEELIAAMDRIIGAGDFPSTSGAERFEKKGQSGQGMENKGGQTETGRATGIDDLGAYKYLMERNPMTGFDGGINQTALVPGLPKEIPGVTGMYQQNVDASSAILDPEGFYTEMMRKTGMSTRDIHKFYTQNSRVLVERFVSNQTRLGKIRSCYALAIAGDQNGRLGIGEAKSVEPNTAWRKARLLAMQNLKPIRRYEDRTIYGNVSAKVGATTVNLFARPPGT